MDTSAKALQEAISVRQQIDTLEKRLSSILDRKSTRLNSSHTVIYTLSLHDALPISSWVLSKTGIQLELLTTWHAYIRFDRKKCCHPRQLRLCDQSWIHLLKLYKKLFRFANKSILWKNVFPQF